MSGTIRDNALALVRWLALKLIPQSLRPVARYYEPHIAVLRQAWNALGDEAALRAAVGNLEEAEARFQARMQDMASRAPSHSQQMVLGLARRVLADERLLVAPNTQNSPDIDNLRQQVCGPYAAYEAHVNEWLKEANRIIAETESHHTDLQHAVDAFAAQVEALRDRGGFGAVVAHNLLGRAAGVRVTIGPTSNRARDSLRHEANRTEEFARQLAELRPTYCQAPQPSPDAALAVERLT